KVRGAGAFTVPGPIYCRRLWTADVVPRDFHFLKGERNPPPRRIFKVNDGNPISRLCSVCEFHSNQGVRRCALREPRKTVLFAGDREIQSIWSRKFQFKKRRSAGLAFSPSAC